MARNFLVAWLLPNLLAMGCAAQTDRAALAPTDAVAIAPDLTVTCAAGARDSFAYDPAARPDTANCHRPVADDSQLELDADASASARTRAVAEFLSAAPSE